MIWQQVVSIVVSPDGGKERRFTLATASVKRLTDEKQQLFLVSYDEVYCFVSYDEAVDFVMKSIESLINASMPEL